MHRARVTYQGAYHRVMNRGYDSKPIFKERKDKEYFLSLLKLYSEKSIAKIKNPVDDFFKKDLIIR